ncbi:hypothetical protein AOA81_06240 [Methanomassiliicoccales archaeon RumEn M2]|nr:hypothetical protein AOA81_06240 [Methanomassiliicoccales archaeon RumEn M2]
MIGLILVAGNNTRIADYLDYPSKVLIPIGGKSLLVRNMDLLSAYVDRFVVVVGKAENDIREDIAQSGYSNRVTYVRQNVASGTLDAVRLAMSNIHDDVFLVLGDEFIIGNRIKSMIEDYNAKDVGISVGIIPDSDEVYIKDAYTLHYDGGYVDLFIEKPKDIFNRDRGTGYYIIKKEIFELLPNLDSGKKDIVDLFNHAIENGHKVVSFTVAEEEFNINTIQQLEKAKSAFNCLS